MIKYRTWLTGIAAIVLLVPLSAAAEYSASLETGAAAINTKDDIKKVNEYSSLRTKNGVNPYGKVDLNVHQSGLVFEGSARFMDAVDQDHSASLDLGRVFRTDFSYSVLQHWLDHDKMQYLDAAIPAAPKSFSGTSTPIVMTKSGSPDITIQSYASNPTTNTLSPNFVPGFLVKDKTTGATYVTNTAPSPGYSNPNYAFQQIGRASVFGEDLTPDAVFKIKRTEWTSKSDLTIPQLPNLTFHFKYRNEDRKGMEQSIGMSKCTSCHVTGQSRDVNENTRDITTGVTGRFGLLTLDYSFMKREFREDAAPPTRLYDPALSPGAAPPYAFDNRLLYDYRDGALRFDETPDSSKDSHVVKAKVDLPGDTTVMASYVNSTVESGKTGEPGIFSFNGANDTKLTSSYDSYGGRLTSVFGKKLTVTVQGRAERLRDDDVALTFYPITVTAGAVPNQFAPSTASLNPIRYSSLSRDTVTTGIDAMYRLASRTTLRLGYNYEMIDRHLDELGKTTSHTVKATVLTRPVKTLSARATVSFKSIDNPYHNPKAALTNSTTNPFPLTVGGGATYGISLYDKRTADLSNQPDQVIDGSISSTWSPSARYSVSVNYRVKSEENDLDVSSWKQTTHGPGLSVWYAPGNMVNLTFAYNYLNQESETAFCQGWYDG